MTIFVHRAVQDQSDGLLPCPFCGSEPLLSHLDSDQWGIDCTSEDCLASTTWGSFARKCEAAAAWNRRSSEAPDAVGAAEAAVGRWVYRRIDRLIDSAPGTPEAAELLFLAAITGSIEEYGEDACVDYALSQHPAPPSSAEPAACESSRDAKQ